MDINKLKGEELQEFLTAYREFQDRMLFNYGRVHAGMQDYFIAQWNEEHAG
jgi:hypothetical protein